jgi:hypothetical protein
MDIAKERGLCRMIAINKFDAPDVDLEQLLKDLQEVWGPGVLPINLPANNRTIVIDHGNGYETSYSHLLAVNVRRGQEVRRGDIIGLSGNTGLSIAPHLHYEVRHNGMRVDPIHYFFMELSPVEYQRIIRIAQSGMQSFD